MKPKFVYFDVGGVVELDFSGTNKWDEFKKELGIKPETSDEFESFWGRYESEACVGTRTIDSVIPLLKEKFGSILPDNYSLLRDGFVKRFEFNSYIWPVIDEIKKIAKVGLLTNMYPQLLEVIRKKGLFLNDEWDVVVDSSVVGFKKPDAEIFEVAQKESKFIGQDIFFVENTSVHVEAAKKFGWQSYLYDSANPQRSSDILFKLIKSWQVRICI